MDLNELKIENLIDKINQYLKEDTSIIEESYNYITNYFNQDELKLVMETAFILTSVYADVETITASLLYKLLTLELVSDKELSEKFPKEIIRIVILFQRT